MNVLSKMSPDDNVEVILNNQKFLVDVASVVKVFYILAHSNGGNDKFYNSLKMAYSFPSRLDELPEIEVDYYHVRDDIQKYFLSDYYNNQARKKQIKYEIEEKSKELLELKSEYFELTGKEYGN